MKLSIIIPMVDNTISIERCVNNLQSVIKKYPNYEVIFVVDNTYNLQAFKDNHNIKGLVLAKVDINSAVELAISKSTGDMVLIGDPKLDCSKYFLEMLKKQKENNLGLVYAKKENKGFCGFFKKVFKGMLNFFYKIFIDKKDHFAFPCLQLITGEALEVIRELPEKTNLIRNCDSFTGIATDFIYISEKPTDYKYYVPTTNLIMVISFICVFAISVLLCILLNIFLTMHLYFNLILAAVILISFMLILILLPRYVMAIRLFSGIDKPAAEKEINFGR